MDLDNTTRNQSLEEDPDLSKHYIKQESLGESRGTTKRILANEIHRVIPHRSLEEILRKTERAHQPKKTSLLCSVSEHSRIPPITIITKFTEWSFTEEMKMPFIKATKNSRNNHILYVSQINVFSCS